jgi:hypothetical protein
VPPRPRDVPFAVLGIALAGAVAGSTLPWTRFGDPSGVFGGWGIDPQRWSSLATYSALVGLVVWLVLAVRPREATAPRVVIFPGSALAIVAGSILHVLNPPPFTHAWLGPWVTLGFGVLAVPAAGAGAWRSLRAEGPNRPAP